MENLRIRAYNVGFGDALLVSVPDRSENGEPTTRNLLIDVGNVLTGQGGQDQVFEPVLRDIEQVLGGEPLDLYVMTHEHLDHVQGPLWAHRHLSPPVRLRARHAWLTASAEGDPYYDRFHDARRQHLAALESYEKALALYNALLGTGTGLPAAIHALMANNNPRSTAQCVRHLAEMGDETTYVYRGCPVEERHPFREARLSLWAPEEDTSSYYSRVRKRPPSVRSATTEVEPAETEPSPLIDPEPPAGVDPESFRLLLEHRRSGHFENLLAIDAAKNNSSVVLLLEWKGWRLLFPGDAELKSWTTMAEAEVLRPVHFLKVSHHGSANGTPRGELLDFILPHHPDDDRERIALASTLPEVYSGVPDADTLEALHERGLSVLSLDREAPQGSWLDIEFPPTTGPVKVKPAKEGIHA